MTLPDQTARTEGRAPLGLIAFLALMTSVVAMTIDAVLPALDAMAADLAFAHANDRQLVIMLVFAGLGLAQLVFGPLADAVGRKRATLIGWAIYLIGTAMGLAATSPEMLLAGRFLQGVGAGGPRVVAVAIVRDLYSGRPMARVLSMVMTVFMLVPMLAPLLGQGIEALAGWRAIFGLYLALALVSAGWYLALVPETLDPARRRAFRPRVLAAAFREVVTTRQTVIAILAIIAVFGSFVSYLATAQQVMEELYGLGPLFPLAFSGLALVFAAGSVLNGRLVMRIGMQRLARRALWAMTAAALAGTALAWAHAGVPPFWGFMAVLGPIFVCVAVLFANLNALAIQPLGHIAGTASSVILAGSTLGAAGIGAIIAQSYDGSVTPLFAGFAGLGLAGACLMTFGGRMEEGG
ncbi:MAG: MFS transporter [Thermohalobaculum sp.]|nr:MFS transporter [Thermohalobaculum sp.]